MGALNLERPSWTFALARVSLRCPDLDAYVQLSCPTRATFAAMKMEAYCDRHAPRDLFDLAGLARIGALDAEAGAVLRAARGFGLATALVAEGAGTAGVAPVDGDGPL